MGNSGYGERLTQARMRLDQQPLVARIHEEFAKCAGNKLASLPLDIRHKINWTDTDAALVVREENYFRLQLTRFIRDPQCDSKNGRCGQCMFHHIMYLIPANKAHAMVFVTERSVLTGQHVDPTEHMSAMFKTSPQDLIAEGNLAEMIDVQALHRHLHPTNQQQVS